MYTFSKLYFQEIYCFGCYGRIFGSSGYRGTSSNVWTNLEASKSLVVRQKESTPLRGVPATIDVNADSCIRCRKPVRMFSNCIFLKDPLNFFCRFMKRRKWYLNSDCSTKKDVTLVSIATLIWIQAKLVNWETREKSTAKIVIMLAEV